MLATLPLLEKTDFPAIRRGKLETLQVNLGYLCNQQCLHCHVNAGPRRREIMSLGTVVQVLDFLEASGATQLDLTGGAPEMNPHFRYLVESASGLGIKVIDRCNLTILEEPGHEDLAAFLAGHRVEVTASLPCYEKDNTDRQRGKGVYDISISALRKLNALGYGEPTSGLVLNLVYNPQGPSLPPPQEALERDYRRELRLRHGIVFNRLQVITNMPIKRFGSMLISKGLFHDYMNLLRGAHQPSNLAAVMCRSTLSVDWEGYLYDCDFNQMLELPIAAPTQSRPHLTDMMGIDLSGRPIVIKNHCYGCTAGQGSSCGGALSDNSSSAKSSPVDVEFAPIRLQSSGR